MAKFIGGPFDGSRWVMGRIRIQTKQHDFEYGYRRIDDDLYYEGRFCDGECFDGPEGHPAAEKLKELS